MKSPARRILELFDEIPDGSHCLETDGCSIQLVLPEEDNNPSKIYVYRDRKFLTLIPVYDHEPTLEEITTSSRVSDDQKREIYKTLISNNRMGLPNWKCAKSLWRVLH